MMLRIFLRLLSRTPQKPTLIGSDTDHVVLYAHVDMPPASKRAASKRAASKREASNQAASNRKASNHPTSLAKRPSGPHTSHRARLLGMRLEHTKLCSPNRCDRLRKLGIITAGDLASADPERLATHFGAPRKAVRILKQYRRAIRFAAAVPGMMPRDAMLLISIHRRSARGLAAESAGKLHRDLERFAESTKGQVQLRGRRIPSTRRLRRWIAECESNGVRSPFRTRVA